MADGCPLPGAFTSLFSHPTANHTTTEAREGEGASPSEFRRPNTNIAAMVEDFPTLLSFTHLLVLVIQGFKVTIRCSREIHLLMPRPHSNKIINDLAREEVQLAAYSRQ